MGGPLTGCHEPLRPASDGGVTRMDDELSLFKLPPRSKPRRRQPSEVKDLFQQARRFHGWTLDKLEVLRLYLKMYRRVAGSGAYLDAFAGEGRALIRGNTSVTSSHRCRPTVACPCTSDRGNC